jgi:hypothetical protein
MKRLAFLIVLVLACSRTPLGLDAPDGGAPGPRGAGGNMVVPSPSGGASGNGGAGGGMGGARSGSGGFPATGGVTGSVGSTTAPDGSVFTTDLDSCSSDADCLTSCIWVTAPTSSSQCTANYCCGMTWLSRKRCDENQARWAYYCPNQAPTSFPCPCVVLCQNETFRCIGGRCTSSCPPGNDAAPDVAFVSDGALGPYCGDGVVNGPEECDNGKNDDDYASTSGCAPGCKLPARCGDGIVQKDYGEVCDYGSKNAASTDPNVAYGECMSNCKVGGWCGDGVVNGPEQCDDGVNDGTYHTCAPDCTLPPWCGDGVVQPEYGEECDDGILDGSYGGCTPLCKLAPHCGDGIINGPECCDDGDGNGRDGKCSAGCEIFIGCQHMP